MTQARPISAARVAKEMLGRSPGWFALHRAELERHGFPKPLPVLSTYLPGAVQAWLDSPSAPAQKESSTFDQGLERLLNGKRRGPAA